MAPPFSNSKTFLSGFIFYPIRINDQNQWVLIVVLLRASRSAPFAKKSIKSSSSDLAHHEGRHQIS